MQQAVGCKCGIVMLDHLISIGEEIHMGEQPLRRGIVQQKAELVYGCFLRGAQLRREDIIVQMLCQKDSCPDVLHLELLQQCFQLWELHLPDRDILH